MPAHRTRMPATRQLTARTLTEAEWYCADCKAGRPVVQRVPYLIAYPYACLGAAVMVTLIVCATILLAGGA